MSRLGIYTDKINAIREQRGLTPSGFGEDGTDPAENDKKEMERAVYDRANHKVSSIASALAPANERTSVNPEGDL
ncbi:hypothetical protein FIU85_08790 [Roseovarius sp. THAF8]|uniref:hypothetical protein n=1 Tax=Roseovarius sp. THAF8 TaxID=2587846 RepID=UPI001267E2F4|nr:hypothetical protein [Roseovarius sp. THAF8]QFT97396.1 hypothetical protein FIU85_08790 [Roseovarius sp. THAF8]